MAHTYTHHEIADMHLAYGLIEGNVSSAQRIYIDKYPNRLVPHATTF